MKPRKHKSHANPSEMTKREIKQANNLHRKMQEALRKDREARADR